ncbi:MAG: aldolase/citrate lyase family protein, partial [Chloroflexi bacterium]|nr:aldolase/citrate lyase family protein [Chloroflexota bacterium]
MRRNSVKRRLLAGETVIGTMVQEVANPSIAQILNAVGFDFFMLDMEHGSFSLETAAQILRVGRILDMCPLVRVRSPEYDLISGPLDHGAMGVMLPRVENRGEVETLVQAVKYPPVGKRGCSSDAPHSAYRFGSLAEFV